MPLIELQAVGKRYGLGDTQVSALQDVNLQIQRGEFIAVWGPSGSGKSTLCNIIGLLDNPSEGSIKHSGRAIAELTDNERSELRNRSIGFIFQNFNLIPVLSALENVMLPLQILGGNKENIAERARQSLAELGLADRLHQRPHKLSGGQQQRVAIARALVTKPDVVLADEPTANLDSVTAQSIIELMRELNQKHQTTFIFSTHDQRLLSQADRKILLRDGRIEEDLRLNGGAVT